MLEGGRADIVHYKDKLMDLISRGSVGALPMENVNFYVLLH